jgi:hypothetical protein
LFVCSVFKTGLFLFLGWIKGIVVLH